MESGQVRLLAQVQDAVFDGYFTRADIPFQYALADAFTICDAYHCSLTTGTDPNRIVFWSGSNFNPALRARGENCTDADAEVNNLRCWIEGALPEPGYRYKGSAFRWPTIPDILQDAAILWRIYQDPNNNWTGAMHGGLAFESFRTAKPDSPLYKNGLAHHSLIQLAEDVRNGNLPQVSWVLPPALWSEHPGPSSPVQGAEFTARVLNALTANPEVWSRTIFFLTFDENDGLFDHVPPPAPPSYYPDGELAGKSTLDLRGEYFSDSKRQYLDPRDTVSGSLRPWGLGPRVPMYVISPWSKGGWVNSQVFDHTSVGQFLEKRFDVTIPAISPWHRAVCGDLTSAFDFGHPNDSVFPQLPALNASAALLDAIQKPTPGPPTTPQPLYQEPGVRPSCALPYELDVSARADNHALTLTFDNTGRMGAVFHVYDKRHLERIPRRYTVEPGNYLTDRWQTEGGEYDLWVYGPNGFLREFKGTFPESRAAARPEIELRYQATQQMLQLIAYNAGKVSCILRARANAYLAPTPITWPLPPGKCIQHRWCLADTGNWYDFTVTAEEGAAFVRRFAGRLETGAPSTSDPAGAVDEYK